MDGEAIGQAAVQPQPADAAPIPKRWPTADELFRNDQVSQKAVSLVLQNSMTNILVLIPNVVQLLSGLHKALTDSGAMTKLNASNKERSNG
jgi:hypothetical protein